MPKNRKIKLDTNFSTAEESPGFLLWKAANLLQKAHITVLRPLKITPAQFSVMTCLVHLSETGLVTPSQVANHAGLDKMMVSDLVKTLEKKKWITTRPNPNDGRSFLIEPTDNGVALTNKAVKCIEEIDEAFFLSERNLNSLKTSLIRLVRSNT